jgi:hypothetical protein
VIRVGTGNHLPHQASPTSRKYLLETMGSGVALFDYGLNRDLALAKSGKQTSRAERR